MPGSAGRTPGNGPGAARRLQQARCDGSSPRVGNSGHRARDPSQSLQAGRKGLQAQGRGCRHGSVGRALQAGCCRQGAD